MTAMPEYIEARIRALAYVVAYHRGTDALITNYVDDYVPFECPVFALRPYCTDGCGEHWEPGAPPDPKDTHPDGCPPCFEYFGDTGFTADWYKHVGRGHTVSRDLDYMDAVRMMQACFEYMLSIRPALPEENQ